MSDKNEYTAPRSATRGYRPKQTPTKPSSSGTISMEFIPLSKKHSKFDFLNKNIEDEEFPRGFTILESSSSNSRGTPKSNLGPDTPSSAFKSDRSQPTGDAGFRQLSLLAEFDELMRVVEEKLAEDITEEFLEFAEHQELCRIEWLKSVNECRRLQEELDKANHEIGDFQNKLKNARRLLDQERKLRKKTEQELFNMEKQMTTARQLLFNEKEKIISEETKEKLSFLNSTARSSVLDRNTVFNQRLDTIQEVNTSIINSTGSLLSDFSSSRSDGEIDTSTVFKMKTNEWRQVNISKKDFKSPKRTNLGQKVVEINPNDRIVATTTLEMNKNGPITATSVIEAVPRSESDSSSQEVDLQEIEEKEASPSSVRPHNFISKTMFCSVLCAGCQSRIFFGKIVSKCKDCKYVCHNECRARLCVPCVPTLSTSPRKSVIGALSDFAPHSPPMVPNLIIHCVHEIELRGLKEVGLYRIPGVEKDIRALKDKLLRIKTIPNLKNIDVHVLCGVIKDFLRSLKEPLVTYALRKDFIQACEAKDNMDVSSCLYQVISQLPQTNRDTLAYVMLHLNRVAASRECRMPSSNLCKIFGPTIVGYSSKTTHPKTLLLETKQQILVMDHLMKIPNDYWSSFVNSSGSEASTPRSGNFAPTPSSVVRSTSRRKFFTPEDPSMASGSGKRTKYFGTPPMFRN